MRHIKNPFLLTVFLFCSMAMADDRITREEVQAMLDAMQQASAARDAESLMSHFTPDAILTADMPSKMGGKIRMTVEQYKSMLLQSWASPAEFSYDVSNVTIEVAADGQSATAGDTTIETISLKGDIVARSRTDQIMKIVSRNGKPAIIALYGKLSLLPKHSRQPDAI